MVYVKAGALPTDLVAVAHVVGAYGVAGAIRLEPYSPDAGALFAAKSCWFKTASSDMVGCSLTGLRWQGGRLISNVLGVSSRDQADAMKGSQVFVSRADFPALSSDEYYWADLIGCDVTDQNDVALGLVVDVVDFGAHPLLQVRQADSLQLIPFVAAHICQVDLPAKQIRVNWCVPE